MPHSPDNTSGLKLLSRRAGAPAVDLSALVLPLIVLDQLREDLARRFQVLPLREKDGHLFLAMADPNNAGVLKEIGFLTGKNLVAYAAPAESLASAIDAVYAARRRGDLEWRGSRAAAAARPTIAIPGALTTEGDGEPMAPLLRQPDAPTPAPPVREPFAADERFQPSEGPSPTAAGRPRPRVLVVDDEPVIGRIVHQALAQRGYDVHEAASGMTALRLIKELEPDVILLDAMLPDVHGFDICKRLKDSRRYRHIPVVMMTAVYKGWRMAADLKESYGVVGYIEKPFDIHEVVRQIESALAGRSSAPPPDQRSISAEAQRLYSESSRAYDRGDLDGAAAALTAAVAIDPLNATLRQQLGLLHAQRGQDFAAIQELEMAVELEPTRFATLRNLAVLFQRRGFRRKACELWERALALAPDEETRQEIKLVLVQLL